jgi:signal transduction histidine kinase/CheY-like chemotaxis protein
LSFAWGGAAAMLAIGILLGAQAERGYRRQTARQVEAQADILAASVGAALAFDDRKAMAEYVDALRINRRVASAGIYDPQGRAVVIFARPGSAAPARIGPVGMSSEARHVTVVRPVTQQDQRLGSVYLEMRPEPWSALAARHSGLALLTLMAFLLVGVMTAAAAQLQARARQLAAANARLREEMAARSKAEEALRQSQKMEALGQLTGGIAHDFNNLLQVVQGAFELIRRRPDDAAKVAAWSQNGLQAAERGASLTRQLLAFSRSQKLELHAFVVGDLVSDMRDLLVRTLGPDITLDFDLQDGAAPVLSDRTQLELAVLNLAINARDAMPDGGRLTLATRVTRIAPGQSDLEPDDYVELRITDTGGGMLPEVIERAFDPFFTTKGVGKGTGLGLSQVYGVARQAGGAARIASSAGGGTTVTLFLRRSNRPAEATPDRSAPQPAPAPRGEHTVLVVDDEAQVRALACETLAMLGYDVLDADSGEAALKILDTTRPDIMLLDYAMPGMSGAELARQARDRWPGLPIVFASGHADTEAVEQALGGQALILRKPFDMESLARALAGLSART